MTAKLAPLRMPRLLVLAWQQRPALRWGVLAVVLGGYAVASLEPFDWEVPRRVANHAERTPQGWLFAEPGLVVAAAPHDWLPAAVAAETLTLSLVVRPHTSTQSGPARILTMSRDSHLRNLTLAQESDDLVLRLRTEQSDLNGLLSGAPLARIPDVFRDGGWVTIELRIQPRQITVALHGRPAFTGQLPPAVLSTWDPAFDVALGNEVTCNRPWLGEIGAAVVNAPGGQRDYATAEHLEVPRTCWVIGYPPVLVPFQLFLVEDAVRNAFMYAPLGMLLGLLLPLGGCLAPAAGLLLVFGISMTFEIAQLFVASRFSSIDDVLYNTIGGGLGLAFALYLKGRLSRRV